MASACNGTLNIERFGEQAKTVVARIKRSTRHQLNTHTIIITLYQNVDLITFLSEYTKSVPLNVASFSGDPLQNTDVPTSASGTIGNATSTRSTTKSGGKSKVKTSSTGRLQSKGQRKTSKGSGNAKALSSGGVCQPPIAPQKSGEQVTSLSSTIAITCKNF